MAADLYGHHPTLPCTFQTGRPRVRSPVPPYGPHSSDTDGRSDGYGETFGVAYHQWNASSKRRTAK